jgi:hypothetical protein
MNEKTELIFIPSPGIGHLASSLEFAKILTNRYNNLYITVLCIKLPSIPSSDSYINSFLASQSQIKLILLPQIEPPSQDLHKSPEFFILNYMESLKPHVKETIQTILPSSSSSSSNKVVGLVLDFFCVTMIDVGEEFGIPSYLYVPSNVGFLSLMCSLQKRRIDEVYDNSNTDDNNQLLNIPGLSNETPINVLPDPCFHKDGYFAYYKLAERFRETKGIIVNTFSDLEQHSIEALHDHDEKIPPIYAIGPLLDLKGTPNPNLDQSQHDLILKWLDKQPNKSVVFLCFGSFGFQFVPSQIREIALGLKNSGVRFLWSNRAEKKVLPDGFFEWMELEGKGMICGWAPQVEILGHKAIGGFVSHCGWNSILESLWFGVPILTWPIYAEQQMNAFMMVKEFGLSVELKIDYRRGSDVIVADEIEKGLKSLMDNDNIVHKKVNEIKELARNAVVDGGSSFISFRKLIDDIIGSK